ncbi:hypothetical protein BWQ96_03104 [Gracilariopsis chorda]|uniref:Uncharacterized protein n=1 Tax=Gracilariopsis chorda TaxID=448386 RepID=A0A2V3IYD4_9FLOR|nr:hypothetical protein BWQ96_03104 [Gracilariopsis chorda]|eukprot:PXF47162.1 hypothetical protein BWQ96_03104 [Gracilariopsis chorda]
MAFEGYMSESDGEIPKSISPHQSKYADAVAANFDQSESSASLYKPHSDILDSEPYPNSEASLDYSDVLISDSEVENLHKVLKPTHKTVAINTIKNSLEEISIAMEDYWACVFTDIHGEQLMESWYQIVEENSKDLLESEQERLSSQHTERLTGWQYASPFIDVRIEFDDVHGDLSERFLKECNHVLVNAVEETKVVISEHEVVTETMISSFHALLTFLPDSLLQNLESFVNKVLKQS